MFMICSSEPCLWYQGVQCTWPVTVFCRHLCYVVEAHSSLQVRREISVLKCRWILILHKGRPWFSDIQLLYTTYEQTFQAIAQRRCLSAKPTLSAWSWHPYYLCSYSSVYLFLQEIFLNSISHHAYMFSYQWCVPPTHAPYIPPVSRAVKLSPELHFVSPKCQKRYAR